MERFAEIIAENKKYVEMLERGASVAEQVHQLEICKACIDRIINEGRMYEYSEYFESVRKRQKRA